MAAKKVPMRMCVCCREMKPKKEMLRIVRETEGEISVDRTGKKNGRGAYICGGAECLKKIKKTKLLSKVFECEVKGEVYDKILEELGVK